LFVEPVLDVVPHIEQRDPWVASTVLLGITREAPADEDPLADSDDRDHAASLATLSRPAELPTVEAERFSRA
jgi:hypothetical protein